MNKIIQLSLAVLCATLMFASCGEADTIKADVAKTKEYLCKGMELGKKAQEGDTVAMSELETLSSEMETYMAGLQEKYPKGSEKEKAFEEEMKKLMSNPEGACQ